MLGRGYPQAIAYSPDGKLFAVGATIGIWLYSGDDVTAPPRLLWDKMQKGAILNIAFSPTGRFIAAGTGGEFPESGDNALMVWDVQSGQVVHHLLGHTAQIADVAYSPDGQFITTVTTEDGMFVWDAETGEIAQQFNEEGLIAVTYSPDGQFIATSRYSELPNRNFVYIRDAQTGNTIHFLPHLAWSLAYSPDGRLLASAWDGVRVWDAETGEEIANFPYEDYINDVAFSPDGQSLAVATYNNAVDIYDVATMTRIETIRAFQNLTDGVVYHPNGETIATFNRLNERAVRWWDAQTYEQVYEDELNAFLNTAIFTADSQSILYSEDFRIAKVDVADLASYLPLSDDHTFISLDRSNYYQSVSWLIVSPDGRLIAASQHDEGITVWDSQTGEAVYHILPMSQRLSRGAFHPYRNWLTALDDGDLYVWDMATGELIQTIALDENINSFAYDTNDDRLVLTTYSSDDDSYNATVYVYDIVSWSQISIAVHEGMNSSVKVKAVPDGRVVWFTDTEGGSKLVHDLDSEAEIVLDASVDDIFFSPDSRLILADTGFNASLWNFETGEKLASLDGNTDWSFWEWRWDGRAIISASSDGTIRVWGVPND